MKSPNLCVLNHRYPADFKAAKQLFEKTYVQEVLIQHKGNVSRSARLLNMGRRHLQDKIVKYKIDIRAIRAGSIKPTRPSKQAVIEAVKLLENYVQVQCGQNKSHLKSKMPRRYTDSMNGEKYLVNENGK